MSLIPFPFFLFFISLFFASFSFTISSPDALNVQSLPLSTSPPATIPAFPEQSNVVGCPLDLPEQLFHSVKNACGTKRNNGVASELHRSRCCPVLAAWLYAAYSATALGGVGRVVPAVAGRTPSYDMPLLPDDSETCVDDLGKALKQRGVELAKPNETCDAVYCYCGIRLHPLTCPDAFSLDQKGNLVGDDSVERLERNCLSSSSNVNGFPGLGGCNKCLKSLHLLNKKNALNTSKSEERTTKMRNKDCQLMGLTWLLAKNRTSYIRTVSAVLRAMMMSKDGSSPSSCTLNSDGMPLPVDSSEIYDQSSSVTFNLSQHLPVLSLCLLLIHLVVLSYKSS
ncbi:putative GPI-anchored protein [Gossypium australe]|uniref:Putative GPI-anchored protein n=1 Tax=Gossypium australe TaxID=47621 RepID=A0A5B6UEW8_9ROSI|nr:putative GPI-anchored protein [Gossypium australe]